MLPQLARRRLTLRAPFAATRPRRRRCGTGRRTWTPPRGRCRSPMCRSTCRRHTRSRGRSAATVCCRWASICPSGNGRAPCDRRRPPRPRAVTAAATSRRASHVAGPRPRPYVHTPTRPHAHTPIRPYTHTPIRPYTHTPTRPHAHTPIRPHAHTPTHAHTAWRNTGVRRGTRCGQSARVPNRCVVCSYLLATLSSQSAALAAAEVDPNRVLPELVYTMVRARSAAAHTAPRPPTAAPHRPSYPSVCVCMCRCPFAARVHRAALCAAALRPALPHRCPQFVPLSRAIPEVYEARMVKLRVKMKNTKGTNTLNLPSGGFQAVELVEDEATHVLVTVDLQAPQRATDVELADREYLSPSAMVDSSDEVIIELAHQGDADLRRMGYARAPAAHCPSLVPRLESLSKPPTLSSSPTSFAIRATLPALPRHPSPPCTAASATACAPPPPPSSSCCLPHGATRSRLARAAGGLGQV